MSEHASHKKGWISLIILAVVLGSVAYGVHRFVSIDDLAQCGKRPTSGACAPADAVVVVSGGDTHARTAEAVQLYKRGWAGLLIVSGAAKDKSGPSNAAVMRRQAVEQGVNPGDILIDPMARNTNQNAGGAVQLARPRGINDIIVVTSPYHLARATLLFEREFADLGTVRGHPSAFDDNWSQHWWLSAHSWRLVGSELVKYALELTRGSMQRTDE